MIQSLEKKRYTPFSERLADEFEVFVWKNRKAQAAKGYNDDLIMAWAIAIWVRESVLGKAAINEDITRVLADCIRVRHTKAPSRNPNAPMQVNIHGGREVGYGIYTRQGIKPGSADPMGRGMGDFFDSVAFDGPSTGRNRKK